MVAEKHVIAGWDRVMQFMYTNTPQKFQRMRSNFDEPSPIVSRWRHYDRPRPIYSTSLQFAENRLPLFRMMIAWGELGCPNAGFVSIMRAARSCNVQLTESLLADPKYQQYLRIVIDPPGEPNKPIHNHQHHAWIDWLYERGVNFRTVSSQTIVHMVIKKVMMLSTIYSRTISMRWCKHLHQLPYHLLP